jgi:prevent-host-death family protein
MQMALSIYQAKTHFSKLVSEVEQTGVRVVILRNRTPVAEIVPLRSTSGPLSVDPALKGAQFIGNPTDPLDAADWPEALR